MYNEVLLIFSPYNEFETRTLDFVDKTLHEFDNRLDKVCIILVSKDRDIENKIKQMNSKNNDSKIIVPFTYNEVVNNLTKQELELKLRKYFYNRDLFALESPLKTEAYFFGRTNIVQTFYDKYSLGEQGGLFGLRKIGKTSVLYALERLVALRGGNSIYIDCQSPSIHKLRWNELLYNINLLICLKYNLDINLISDKINYTETTAATLFEEDIGKIKKKLNNRRILLIFDEIEHISFNTSSTEHWAYENDFIHFWQTIRAIFQQDDSLFSFVIAGVNPMCIEEPTVNGYDNPIFSMLSPTYLELFSVKDVKEMISSIGNYMGISFDEEIYSLLTDNYGGHPFLIRHVCSLINSNIQLSRPYTVTKYEYKERKNEYDSQLTNYIELILGILKKWYPEEYELLEILVISGVEPFKQRLQYHDNAIQHLLGYGILKNINGGYYLTINAIETYIKNKNKLKNTKNTKESVWEEVSVRRNTIEEKLRKIILINLASGYGKKNVKNKILEIIDTDRREVLKGLDVTIILNEKLYLLDLKKIILKNWSNFELLFNDKIKFTSFIDYINSNRIDAHAKTISDDDLGLLRVIFKWFEDILGDIA